MSFCADLLAEALELGQLLGRQAIEIRRSLHEVLLYELVDALVAEPFDVQCEPRREVAYRLLALSGAKQPADAARDRLALASLDVRAADGALWAAA